MSSLLQPVVVGNKLHLPNRVVMGSMTRNRCVDDCKPGGEQIQHYSERAKHGAGLIIAEGTFIDWQGCDWKWAPLMITEDHAQAWKKVTTAVHTQGGKIYFQPWHLGRCQNEQIPLMQAKNHPVVAPSKIPARGGKYRDLPGTPGHTHNITEIENPRDFVNMYRHSAILAKRAGFDGIELLAQGGYLPQQFLNSRANIRTDAYGGSVVNRCRFILEVSDVLAEVFGSEFVCIKLCPTDQTNDSVVTYEEMKDVYTHLIKELVKRRIGIINLSRRGANHNTGTGDFFGNTTRPDGFPLPLGYDPVIDFGPLVKFSGSPSMLMANYDYTVDEANRLVEEGKLDLITFGRPFIYNPDVIFRIQHSIPFAENNRGNNVHYGPFEEPNQNYNDWPIAAA
ncbi:uncharacterized protein CCOS01_00178 [Colletotrichum costaricense]|uniref:NADH:flavin oxidoreductase/NADH oxidase N-terminal domain-containing protein n=1 Tax=Colletotrichum costaricense TaxID=1209916 RepID=A0AAJ0E7M8_9PEZI|nr:uncharacterized protein CCOS01_00178 [Colletotrichum costaricense]KAK1538864.1 hypothetical protein CCOS01_00178 [Colletotrichum costaricense]